MEYSQTEISKKARKKLTEIVIDYHLKKELETLEYNPSLTEEFLDSNGRINLEAISRSLGIQDESTELLKRCVELNLNEEQVGEIIKFRHRKKYGPEVFPNYKNFKEKIKNSYISWCDYFKIKPDENFPNW